MRTWKKTVETSDNGKKLETYLLENGFTKREISRLKFKKPGMMINDQQARSTAILQTGQIVQVCLEDQDFHAEYINDYLENTNFHLEILYEDADLLVVHKPSGLSCHPGKGHFNENLGSIVTAYCLKQGITCPIREIGRLDKDTSGLMIFAKNRDTAARLWKQKQDGIFTKTYMVLVHGNIGMKEMSGKITFDMAAVPDVKNRMQICENGLYAVTNYRVLKNLEMNGYPVSLVECKIETGRTHQIRVHMAALGHPVVGDSFYGIEDNAKRLCLHAGEVEFLQPYTKEKIHIQIPVTGIPFE